MRLLSTPATSASISPIYAESLLHSNWALSRWLTWATAWSELSHRRTEMSRLDNKQYNLNHLTRSFYDSNRTQAGHLHWPLTKYIVRPGAVRIAGRGVGASRSVPHYRRRSRSEQRHCRRRDRHR